MLKKLKGVKFYLLALEKVAMDVGEVVVMTEDMVTEVIEVAHPLDAPHHPTITVEDDPGVTTVQDQGLTRRVSTSFILFIFYRQSLVFVAIPDLLYYLLPVACLFVRR